MTAALRLQEPVEVPLHNGQAFLVDAADAPWVTEHAWRLDTKGYVRRTDRGADGKRRTVFLHRLIAEAAPGQFCDHRDGNPRNCQRDNLRLTTPLGNAQNIRNSKNAKAGKLKGVYRTASGKWAASIGAGEKKPNGKARLVYLGSFPTPELAAKAYDDAALRYFGEHAATNFLSPADEAWALEKLREAQAAEDALLGRAVGQ